MTPIKLKRWQMFLSYFSSFFIIMYSLFLSDQPSVAFCSNLEQKQSYMRLHWDLPPLTCSRAGLPVLVTSPSQTSCCGVIRHKYKSTKCRESTAPPTACKRQNRRHQPTAQQVTYTTFIELKVIMKQHLKFKYKQISLSYYYANIQHTISSQPSIVVLFIYLQPRHRNNKIQHC